jgi:SAM-dependent methyltransferase
MAIGTRRRFRQLWHVSDQAVGLSDKVLFDIGAGEGKFLEYAALRNCSVFGIEPSQANCDLMKQSGIRHFCGTIESYQASADFERDLADIVTVMWTLENCTSARNMIQAGVNLLKPGGHLVVSTGSRILVPFKKPLGTYLGNSPADLHCFRFSAQTLKKLLSSCGLTIVTSNEYLTNDILCVVAKKEGSSTEEHPGDNWRKVYDFFERWHKESLHYER